MRGNDYMFPPLNISVALRRSRRSSSRAPVLYASAAPTEVGNPITSGNPTAPKPSGIGALVLCISFRNTSVCGGFETRACAGVSKHERVQPCISAPDETSEHISSRSINDTVSVTRSIKNTSRQAVTAPDRLRACCFPAHARVFETSGFETRACAGEPLAPRCVGHLQPSVQELAAAACHDSCRGPPRAASAQHSARSSTVHRPLMKARTVREIPMFSRCLYVVFTTSSPCFARKVCRLPLIPPRTKLRFAARRLSTSARLCAQPSYRRSALLLEPENSSSPPREDSKQSKQMC